MQLRSLNGQRSSYAIQGLGYRQAAEALGLPIGTVSSRLVRRRNALLSSLGAGADE